MGESRAAQKFEITANMEDYLEVIFELSTDLLSKNVRVTDIAHRLRVSRPSVVGMVRHLEEHGLVIHDRYGRVRLTPAGTRIARETLHRHRVLRRFLEEVLGLDAEIAETDACRMEHTLSPETLDRFVALEEFRERGSERGELRGELFRKFLKERRRQPPKRKPASSR